MQIPALFTVLAILGTTLAAPNPLLLGIPGIAQLDVPTNGLSKEALAALIVPPAVPSNAAAAQNAIASIIANLPLPSDGVKVSINPSILPTGVSLPVVPSSIPIPASATDALKALNGFINGLKPTTTSTTDAVAQLKKIQGDLEAAIQQATADLKANGANYQQYVDSASATVKSLNSILTSLPKTVQTDGNVKVAAAAVDAQLASLVSTLKAASASSTKFATDFAKAGINVKSTGSSLLSKTAAAIPAPSGLAGLLSGFGF